MRRFVVLGAVARAAAALVLVAALAASPIGAAASATRSSCNLESNNCPGYVWGGPTSQPGYVVVRLPTAQTGAIVFYTDLSQHAIARITWDVLGEHCTAYPTKPIPISGSDGQHAFRIVAGHISITQTDLKPVETQLKLPGVVSHMTGTFADNHASGTVQWSLVGPYKDACRPSSGSFTWHATTTGKIATA